MALNKIHHGPFSRIGNRYNRFIDPTHFMGRDATSETWIAPANTLENNDELKLEVCLPGFKKEEVSICVVDDVLEVSAKKKRPLNKEYLTKEMDLETASRKFNLPRTVDRDRISAELEDGILKIKLANKKSSKDSKKFWSRISFCEK